MSRSSWSFFWSSARSPSTLRFGGSELPGAPRDAASAPPFVTPPLSGEPRTGDARPALVLSSLRLLEERLVRRALDREELRCERDGDRFEDLLLCRRARLPDFFLSLLLDFFLAPLRDFFLSLSLSLSFALPLSFSLSLSLALFLSTDLSLASSLRFRRFLLLASDLLQEEELCRLFSEVRLGMRGCLCPWNGHTGSHRWLCSRCGNRRGNWACYPLL